MIRRLEPGERACLSRFSGWSGLELRALANAYGLGRGFLPFYGDEKAVFCLKGGQAVLALEGKPSKASREELAALLPLLAEEVWSEYPLEGILPGFARETGWVYRAEGLEPLLLPGVSERIAEGYEVLDAVFPDRELVPGSESFNQAYCDLSHRIRHGTAQIFTLPGRATLTAAFLEPGRMLVSDLAVHPDFRRQGLAKSLLRHSLAACGNRELLLLSRQDGFYDRLGFAPSGQWFQYSRHT